MFSVVHADTNKIKLSPFKLVVSVISTFPAPIEFKHKSDDGNLIISYNFEKGANNVLSISGVLCGISELTFPSGFLCC